LVKTKNNETEQNREKESILLSMTTVWSLVKIEMWVKNNDEKLLLLQEGIASRRY
jgi:hypothetical protein